MKVALVVLALLGLGFSSPQSRKLFHEHFDEFMEIIREDAGHDLGHLMEHYLEFEEFVTALDYIKTKNFKDLIYEMESLPEFQAVVEFLENDNIDIHFFIDIFNEMMESTRKRHEHVEPSGKDFGSFIEDSITLFPKDKLSALYDQKIAEDAEFKAAIENLKSDEWVAVFTALWDNDTFQAEVQTLADYGIDVHAVLHEIVAVFGQ